MSSATIKHYAFNDQETGRTIGNVMLDERGDARKRSAGVRDRRSRRASPASVMCSYNKVNGDGACENDYLLNQVLKQDWGYQGLGDVGLGRRPFHRKAALAGLDQESGAQLDSQISSASR